MKRDELKITEGWEFALNTSDSSHFKPVNIPHDWVIHKPFQPDMPDGVSQGFRNGCDVGWYRRKLTVDRMEPDCIYELEFGGIYENSTVWINEIQIGGRKYGYSSFLLDITAYLKPGDNDILVKVDASSEPHDRWYSGGGIYRPVTFRRVNKQRLNPEHIHVITGLDEGAGTVTVQTGADGQVLAVLRSPGGSKSFAAEAKGGRISFRIENPLLWSPEEPNLYDLTLSLKSSLALEEEERVADSISLKVGIREIQLIPHEGMYLNGQVIKLKGLCIHQDLGCMGIEFHPEMWKERLLLLKKVGCNAVRAAHHIFASEFLDLCDEIGLLVYEEAFDKWTAGSYGRYFQTEWQSDLDCMVKRDRNHPCIFIWGVGNEVENQGQAAMLEILKAMKERVLALDHTRPVSYAMNPHFKYESDIDVSTIKDIQAFVDEVDHREILSLEEKIRRITGIAKLVDIVCCNYQEQWFEDIHRAVPDKLILATESYQFFRGEGDKFFNYSYEIPWFDVEKHDYVIGNMIWSGIEYLGESMGFPSKGHPASLIYTTNERKPMSYVYQSYWSREPMVYFAPLDYTQVSEMAKEHWDAPRYASHWDFRQYEKAVLPYIIATNCEEVTLQINDKQIALKKPCKYPNRLITGYAPFFPGKVSVRGYIGGVQAAEYRLSTPKQAVKLLFDDGSGEEVTIEAMAGYHRLFTVRAVDMDNVPVYKESACVVFGVEGPAEIVGVDSGNLRSEEAYDSLSRHMYQGSVSAVLRFTGEKGRVELHAYAGGLHEGSLVVNVV